jgi:opacity protein-like surface antigen
MKYVYESLFSEKSITIINTYGQPEEMRTYTRAMLFDFGMKFNTGYRNIQIGAAIQNFGADIKFARENYPAPMILRLGIAGDLVGQNALIHESQNNRLTVDYDMIQPNDYARQAHLGLEYSLMEVVALRAGYKFNYDSDGLTFGAGANTDIAGANISFDYSFGTMGEYLGNVHRLSLGVKLK